jgi:hypothetical protein
VILVGRLLGRGMAEVADRVCVLMIGILNISNANSLSTFLCHYFCLLLQSSIVSGL